MAEQVTEEEKQKYCEGFIKCTLSVTDYAEKMNIKAEHLKKWLKEYREPPKYGKINIAELVANETKEETEKTTGIKFETETIKIELKENYDKKLLFNFMEVLAKC